MGFEWMEIIGYFTAALGGGVAAMLVYIGGNQTPDYPYRVGRGWFVVGMRDNNWD